jgi:hypothetical protein
MKRFLSKGAAESLDKAEQAAAKKARTTPPDRQPVGKRKGSRPTAAAANSSPATSLMLNGWTDLGQQAQIGYWPRMLSGTSQAAMRTLLEDIQWQQVCWTGQPAALLCFEVLLGHAGHAGTTSVLSLALHCTQ